MDLKKALEILLLNRDEAADKMPPEVMLSLCIACEAIEYVLDQRATHPDLIHHLFLHETK